MPNSFLHPPASNVLLLLPPHPSFPLYLCWGLLYLSLFNISPLLPILGSHVFSFPLRISPSITLLKV